MNWSTKVGLSQFKCSHLSFLHCEIVFKEAHGVVAPLVQIPGLLHTEFPWPGKRQDRKDNLTDRKDTGLLHIKNCSH